MLYIQEGPQELIETQRTNYSLEAESMTVFYKPKYFFIAKAILFYQYLKIIH